MQTTPVTIEDLESSPIAVPPLSRDNNHDINRDENAKIIRHIEDGGVRIFLYGGNANFYHIRPSEFEGALAMIEECAGEDSIMIPSAGPAYGLKMDQAKVIKETKFPTVMVLPQEGIMTEAGLLTGFRHFVEAIDRPAVLYIKRDGYITPKGAAQLVDEGLVSFIKYAIVQPDPAEDPYLAELVETVDRKKIVSGIGEQPAVAHLTKFDITGFTAGCICLRPELTKELLEVIQSGNLQRAEEIQAIFKPLEDLRNGINPIRVLHEAVELAGIAKTGPQIPLLCGLNTEQRDQVKSASLSLMNT